MAAHPDDRARIAALALAAGVCWPFGVPGAESAVCVEPAPSAARQQALPAVYPQDRCPADSRAFPWRAIGRLSWAGARGACTGTLVGERWVLTAAHCVWPARRQPTALRFLAGFRQGHAQARAGALRIVLAGDPPLDQSRAPWPADWALIELDAPLGQTVGWLPWRDDAGADPVLTLAGYRADRPLVLTVATGCRVTGRLDAGGLLRHDCPVAPGDSGGPLLVEGDGRFWLFGIQLATLNQTAGAGLALPIAGALRDRLRAIGPAPR